MLPGEVWQVCPQLLLVDSEVQHSGGEEGKRQLGAALLVTQAANPPGAKSEQPQEPL